MLKNIKLIKLRNYQIKCLYDFAEYGMSIPKLEYGDKTNFIKIMNIVSFKIININANILYCGIGMISYLKLIQDYQKDGSEYAIKDEMFNCGILYGMKLKCLPNNIIPRNEFVYIDRKSDEIIKYKIEE